MDERTVIISSRELSDHAVLTRRRNELSFKKDILVRSGAKEGDLHLKALNDEIGLVEEKLSPISEKLSIADMITVVPNRKEITEFSEKINKFSRAELESSVKNRAGEAFELMKNRATLVKSNFERRDDIARITICLNAMPRKEAESLRLLIEEGSGEDVDVSFLPKDKQQELVNLSSRLGRECFVSNGRFSSDKKKVEFADVKAPQEVLRTITGGKPVWVEASKIPDFEANEKVLSELLAKIQSKGAEKQARTLTDEENLSFDKMQGDYLSALQKRAEYARGMGLDETAKVYKKDSWKKLEEAH